jgi:hypothetical protein
VPQSFFDYLSVVHLGSFIYESSTHPSRSEGFVSFFEKITQSLGMGTIPFDIEGSGFDKGESKPITLT